MACRPFRLPDGTSGFVCGNLPRQKPCATTGCGRLSVADCDFPVTRGGKVGTCDRAMCPACRRRQRPNGDDSIDFCPPHDEHARREAAHAALPPAACEVWTARLGYRATDDWLDVSLQGNMRRAEAGEEGGHRGIGLSFCPSPGLLYPYVSARRFGRLGPDAWERYRDAYTAEMRVSYRTRREHWDRLLAMPRVVLLCFCSHAVECHRHVLAELLGKVGGTVRGEVVHSSPEPAQAGLFDDA